MQTLPAHQRSSRSFRHTFPSCPQFLKSKGGIAGVKFMYEGEEVFKDQTPDDLGMENDSEMEALMQQTGGC